MTERLSGSMPTCSLRSSQYSTQLWLSRNLPPVVFPTPPCQHSITFELFEASP